MWSVCCKCVEVYVFLRNRLLSGFREDLFFSVVVRLGIDNQTRSLLYTEVVVEFLLLFLFFSGCYCRLLVRFIFRVVILFVFFLFFLRCFFCNCLSFTGFSLVAVCFIFLVSYCSLYCFCLLVVFYFLVFLNIFVFLFFILVVSLSFLLYCCSFVSVIVFLRSHTSSDVSCEKIVM